MITDNRTKELSQTLSRGLRLLDLIGSSQESVSIRELVDKTGLPRSIIQRLVATLEAEGFVQRDVVRSGYVLSTKLWTLGCVSIRQVDLRAIARPYLQDLTGKSNEMAKLGILDGADVVYLDGIDSPQAVRAYVPIGGRAPVHASATGKAIIAYLPNERLKSLGISGRRYTAKTVVGSDALLKEFEQIRKRGYAVNRGEWAEDVGAVASSIFNANGDPIGSVGIILPLVRLSPAKIPQMGAWVIKAATEISTKLGYRADARIAGLKRA